MQKQHNSSFSVQNYNLAGEFPTAYFLENRMDQPREYLPLPHVHNVIEIGYCHEGRGVFSIAGKMLPFRTNDVVVINHLEPHYAANTPGVASTWSWIFFDPPRLLGAMPVAPDMLDVSRLCGPKFSNVIVPKSSPGIASIVRLVIEELKAKQPNMQETVRGLLLSLLSQLHRLEGQASRGNSATGKRQVMERLNPALAMIQQRYAERLSVRTLAKACNMSETHLRHHFQKAFGRGPYQHLQQYRLSMACTQLEDSRFTVAAIAEKNGFPTLSCFVRTFQKAKGIPPRRWARQTMAG